MKMECKYNLKWHELDQAIELHENREFYFLKNTDPPCFGSAIDKEEDVISWQCIIKSIWHPELGSISKIDTSGLEYTVILMDGREIKIEAEESPGLVYGSSLHPNNWEFIVEVIKTKNT